MALSAPKIALLLALLALALPASAAAQPRQLSIMQDDAVFLGLAPGKDPDLAMAEAKALGVDVVRAFVSWQRVAPEPDLPVMPFGFDPGDPNSPGYEWRIYDEFIQRAKKHGLRVFLTLSPPIPHWASDEPEVCPHFVGGYKNLGKSCMWKPNAKLFGQFAKAVALRYGLSGSGPLNGQVDLYSMWNEPNLEHYLYPQFRKVDGRQVDFAAKRYRRLWWEGWKAIDVYDYLNRGRVLFGETAAISSPVDTLYAALCLDENGRPFRGKLKVLQGCVKPRRLPIGGIATHPYNNNAGGSVFTRSFALDSLPLAYLNRLHRVMNRAARRKRIPPRKEIWLTEFGFQSNPPDPRFGLRLRRHATAINEAERLFFADRRVRAISQFELYDVGELADEDVYNTALRTQSGERKPAWAAFRMPIVVQNLGKGVVEVWGQVRPARGRVRALVRAARPGVPSVVAGTPLTNRAGYFRFRFRRRDTAKLRYRHQWTSPAGEFMRSRLAGAGKRIRYRKDPKPKVRGR